MGEAEALIASTGGVDGVRCLLNDVDCTRCGKFASNDELTTLKNLLIAQTIERLLRSARQLSAIIIIRRQGR